MLTVVLAYSKYSNGNEKASEHFKVREFACKDGSDPVLVAPLLLQILEAIRAHFGKAVVITSGYRTPAHNKAVGGSARSQHCLGTAADIKISGVAPETVADYARLLMPNFGGVGRYKTFTHIDVRQKRTDWRG